MKVVILAGGLGTRLEEETVVTPKPLVHIGDYPILWHIMKIYSTYGFHDFIICLGYKGYLIKEYFANYFMHHSDLTFDFSGGNNDMIIHNKKVEPWRVSLVDTGLNTMTGGRIKRIQPYIDDDMFMLTYGDGVADINVVELVKFHKSHGKTATITTIQPGGRFGILEIEGIARVKRFVEKPPGDGAWVNGGFMVLNSEVFDYITEGDMTILEKTPLEKLADENRLMAYHHRSFWKCMDTIRDKNELDELWNSEKPPWKIWE